MSKFTNLLLLTELAESLNIPAIDREWHDSKTVFAKYRAAKKALAKVKQDVRESSMIGNCLEGENSTAI
jgi:hypothetical protein